MRWTDNCPGNWSRPARGEACMYLALRLSLVTPSPPVASCHVPYCLPQNMGYWQSRLAVAYRAQWAMTMSMIWTAPMIIPSPFSDVDVFCKGLSFPSHVMLLAVGLVSSLAGPTLILCCKHSKQGHLRTHVRTVWLVAWVAWNGLSFMELCWSAWVVLSCIELHTLHKVALSCKEFYWAAWFELSCHELYAFCQTIINFSCFQQYQIQKFINFSVSHQNSIQKCIQNVKIGCIQFDKIFVQ